ncbi:MAG: STAS domain-containing protein [Desulfobulbaceae bacterium]|nr:STAS domain-containing protein [Desulfobulbaceae bacterium]
MECQVSQQGDIVRFHIKGRIDEAGAERIKQQFKCLHLHLIRQLIIDLEECSYIGSSGIGKLLLFYKHLAGHNGTLSLEKVTPAIGDLLKELKLDTLFEISPA